MRRTQQERQDWSVQSGREEAGRAWRPVTQVKKGLQGDRVSSLPRYVNGQVMWVLGIQCCCVIFTKHVFRPVVGQLSSQGCPGDWEEGNVESAYRKNRTLVRIGQVALW